MSDAYMVKQTITYSDGTETVINYRGVIKDGVLLDNENNIGDVDTTSTPKAKRAYKKRK